jgi:hypothetical protein
MRGCSRFPTAIHGMARHESATTHAAAVSAEEMANSLHCEGSFEPEG